MKLNLLRGTARLWAVCSTAWVLAVGLAWGGAIDYHWVLPVSRWTVLTYVAPVAWVAWAIGLPLAVAAALAAAALIGRWVIDGFAG